MASTSAPTRAIHHPLRIATCRRCGRWAAIEHRHTCRASRHLARRADVEACGRRVVDVIWRDGRVAGVKTAWRINQCSIRWRQQTASRRKWWNSRTQRAALAERIVTAERESLPERHYTYSQAPSPASKLIAQSGCQVCIDVPITEDNERSRSPIFARIRPAAGTAAFAMLKAPPPFAGAV